MSAAKESGPKARAVVFGATGKQGGSVVDALLKEGKYEVVAVTRSAESEKAKALVTKGASVVEADMGDKAACQAAVQDADFVFLVTQFWEKFDQDLEEQEGKNVIDACKDGKVGFLVFSTLEDISALNEAGMSCGKIEPLESGKIVPHFDGKGRAMAYCKESGVKAAYLKLSFYMDNWNGPMMQIKPSEDGKFTLSYPLQGHPMGLVAVEDTGAMVAALFKNADKYAGKEIGAAGDVLTGEEIVAVFSEVFGKTVEWADVEVAAFKAYGFPGAGEFGNMFQAYQDLEKLPRSVEETKALYLGTKDLKTFLTENKESEFFADLNA